MDVKLVMFKADGERRDIPLTKPVIVVGRGDVCGLRIPVRSVSRRHCELAIEGDELIIRDLGSSNGTFVNGERISEDIELDAGDRVTVGPVTFTVQIGGYPKEVKPIVPRPEDGEIETPEMVLDLGADSGQPAAEEDQEEATITMGEPPTAVDSFEDVNAETGDEVTILVEEAEDEPQAPAAPPQPAKIDFDPIAALEALAAQQAKEEED